MVVDITVVVPAQLAFQTEDGVEIPSKGAYATIGCEGGDRLRGIVPQKRIAEKQICLRHFLAKGRQARHERHHYWDDIEFHISFFLPRI
jgi:hypothetical protein